MLHSPVEQVHTHVSPRVPGGPAENSDGTISQVSPTPCVSESPTIGIYDHLELVLASDRSKILKYARNEKFSLSSYNKGM